MTLSNSPLDHVGIAVKNLDEALIFYTQKLGFELLSQENLASQNVILCFIKLQNTTLELLQPDGKSGALYRFMEKRGEGLHHLCYRVTDIKSTLQELKISGFNLIDEAPRPGAHGSMVAFIHPKSTQGVLTEICQYPEGK